MSLIYCPPIFCTCSQCGTPCPTKSSHRRHLASGCDYLPSMKGITVTRASLLEAPAATQVVETVESQTPPAATQFVGDLAEQIYDLRKVDLSIFGCDWVLGAQLMVDVLDILTPPISRLAAFKATSASRSLAGRRAAQAFQARAAAERALDCRLQTSQRLAMLPDYLKPSPPPAPLSAEECWVRDYGHTPTTTLSTWYGTPEMECMELAYQAHVGSAAFGRDAAGVRQLQKVVLRKDRNARAFAQRCLKRQLKAQAAAAAAEQEELESQALLAAGSDMVHPGALPPSWEVVAESAPLKRGIVHATSKKAGCKGPKPLYRGCPELAAEGSYLALPKDSPPKVVKKSTPAFSGDEELCSFSDSSSCGEECLEETVDCATCAVPVYLEKFYGSEWLATWPGCPYNWGLLHFNDDESASLFLFELMQAKTKMGVHGYELSGDLNLHSLTVMQSIDILYQTFSSVAMEHQKEFASLQLARSKARKALLSPFIARKARKLAKRPITWTQRVDKTQFSTVPVGCGPSDWIKEALRGLTTITSSLYERVKTDIVKALSSFFLKLGSLTQLFWDSVKFVEDKVKSFLDEHWFASLIGFSLVSSFVLFLAICICVNLFCNLCSWLGFSGGCIVMLLSLASGAFLAYLGLKHCIDLDWDTLLMRLVNVFNYKNIPTENDQPEGNMFGLDASAIFAPFIWLIKKIFPSEIAKRNGLFSAASHFSSSVTGLSKLKDQFVKFGERVLEYTSNVFDAVCGKSAASIRMLSRMIEIDFSSWCLDVEKYGTETYEAMVINKCARLKKLRLLDDQRLSFEPSFLDPVNKMPHIACQMFWKASETLAAARFRMGRCKFFDKPRVTPFCIWFYGESGCGKSAGVQNVMNDLLDRTGHPVVDRFYSRKISTEYWDNYDHQTCCIYDDIGAAPGAEEDFFDVVTNVPVPVHMSDNKEKGRIFTSEFVVCTSNLLTKRPDSKLADQMAFDNRRHAFFECRRNPDYDPTTKNRYDYTQYTIRSPNTPGYPYRNSCGFPVEEPEWFGHSTLVDILYDSYRIHSEKCQVAMGNCGMDEFNLGVTDFFFLCKDKLKTHFQDDGNDDCQYTLTDFQDLVAYMDKFDPSTGMTLASNSGLDIDRQLQLTSLMNYIHHHFTDEDVIDCVSILPLSKRGRIYSALVEDEYYIFETNYLFNNFEKYLFHRLKLARPIAKAEISCFRSFYESFKKKLVVVYNKALEKAPAFIKFALAIGFFFLFGYGFYVAACKLTGCATSIGGLSAVIATGCGLSMSQDNKTKEKEKKVDHSYQKSSWVPNTGRYWADDEEAFGNSADEEFVLPEQILTQVESNFDYVKPYVVALTDITDPKKPCTAVGFSLGGTCVLLVGHTWQYQIKSGLYHYRCGMDEIKFYLPKTRIKCVYIPGFDLVAVQLPAMVPKARGKGFDMLPKNRSLVPDKGPFYSFVPTCQLSGSGSQISVSTTYQYRPITDVTRELHFLTYDVVGKTYPVSPGCGYRSYLGRGDCGAVAFSPTESGKPPVVCLMHDSAKPGQPDRLGHGSFLTQEDLAPVQVLRNMIAAEGNCGYFEKQFGLREANVKRLGNVAPQHRPRYSRNTQLEPSLISKIVDIPNTQAPAIISNSDPRIPESSNPTFDVFEAGMSKYKEAALPMAGIDEDQQEDFQDALDDIFECLSIPISSLAEVSEEVALQGIPGVEYFDPIVPSTSEGWPWTLQRPVGCKGKSWLLEGIAGCFTVDRNSPFGKAKDQWELDLQQGGVPELVGTECPKDETVPLRKVTTKLKTRLFTVLPFEYNLLVREYFLEFVAEYMKRHDECPGKVGINVHGLSWTNLYHRLKSKGNNWANGDFERFDGITPRDVLVGLVVRINKLYAQGTRPMANQVRSGLVLQASDRYSIAGEGFYRVTGGIPSGFPLTVIVNSLVNEFFLRFAFKRLVRASLGDRVYCSRENFEKEVELAVYGDDNLISVTDRYKDIYNLRTISDFLKQFNINLKNGQDKDEVDFAPFSTPDKCDFLKRRMVLSEEGRVLCPLNIESIQGMAHWVRKSSSCGDATHQNCQSILREAFYNGAEFFHDIRRKLVSACHSVGLDTKSLLTYDAAKRAYLGEVSPYLKLYSPIEGMPRTFIGVSDFFQRVLPDVYLMGISAPRSKIPEGASVVWCGPTDPYKPFITHRCVTPANAGYVNKTIIRRVLKTIPKNKPLVFLSPDGLSQAIPPLILYVRSIYGLASDQERDILERASRVNGSLPIIWLEVLGGDGSRSFRVGGVPEFSGLCEQNNYFNIDSTFEITCVGVPSKFCRSIVDSAKKPTIYGVESYLDQKTGAYHAEPIGNSVKEAVVGCFCGGNCPRHVVTKRTGDFTINVRQRALNALITSLCD
nr:polyprotein P1 [Alpine wild prunus virus]